MVVPLFLAVRQRKQELHEIRPSLFSKIFLEDKKTSEKIQKALEKSPRELELMLTITRMKPYCILPNHLVDKAAEAIELAGLKTLKSSNKERGTYVYSPDALSEFLFFLGVNAVSPREYLKTCDQIELLMEFLRPNILQEGSTTIKIYAEGLEGSINFTAPKNSNCREMIEEYGAAIKKLEAFGVKNLGKVVAELRVNKKIGGPARTSTIIFP
ncbi:MAG: hypothetical protein QW035_02030 [Candidatus Anstonellales archaeon]